MPRRGDANLAPYFYRQSAPHRRGMDLGRRNGHWYLLDSSALADSYRLGNPRRSDDASRFAWNFVAPSWQRTIHPVVETHPLADAAAFAHLWTDGGRRANGRLFIRSNQLSADRQIIGNQFVADYSFAVTIDGGLLLLVTAVATTLLPRTALAHAAGSSQTVHRYYIRGTLATALLLLVAAPIVVLAAPVAFRIVLGNPLPDTCAILPLILIHTVIGGSSAVGRSILLAIGRVRAFTISVLIAGMCNIILGFIFVYYFDWASKESSGERSSP